jgi:integrase
MAEGIRVRHSRPCQRELAEGKPPLRDVDGKPCRCRPGPSYEASVYSPLDHKKIRETFPTPTAARRWRNDALSEVHSGRRRAPTPVAVRQASEKWLKLAKAGVVRTRSGDAYKPSALRLYEEVLRLHLWPEIGAVRLSDLTRPDLQRLANRMMANGLSPSRIRNVFLPIRATYRDAELLGASVPVNPTVGLRLPAVRGRRDRIVSPADAERFLSEVKVRRERALWATALYAGLRRGELAALRWEDVDLAQGVIRVERSWDFTSSQVVEPKSRAGRRRVPIPSLLRDELVELRLDHEQEDRADGLVFGEGPETPFRPSGVARRGQATWRAAGLEPVGLHEARHCFASLMIAAGVNVKALSTFMGHANISVTLDRYGHLLPGAEDEAAALLDRYLQQAREEAAREVGSAGADGPERDRSTAQTAGIAHQRRGEAEWR